MGTRSTTHFIDYGRTVCSVYRQSDGYPSGVGIDLATFLRDTEGNGLSNVAAQYIKHITGDDGYNVYMTTPDDVQEYNYYVEKMEYNIPITIKVTQQKFVKDEYGEYVTDGDDYYIEDEVDLFYGTVNMFFDWYDMGGKDE